MKTMKKLFSMLMVLAMALSMMTGMALAEEGSTATKAFSYVAADGTSFDVTEEAILSCNKTANENYLLSEVLAAAGASMEAECCYKVEAADGYTVYLDAAYSDSLALYNNGGWRTTFDTVPEGIVGGWYKVSGFTTITAVGHSYTDGKCTNEINTSKAEKKVCGAVANAFTYVAADGTSVAVTEEAILSCNKTANENYLLSDVLAAAGASMEAECCYKVEAADGYTVYLDAAYADALALYNNGGWRTTFDTVPEGIVGGWYKVSGFTTITAVNHSYTDGKCTNSLNMSKAEKKVCEAEEPVTTVALSDCKVTLSSTTLTYNGSYRYPKVTVTLPDGTVAVKGTDYTLASKNNKYAGTATITVTAVEGSSLLTGETSAKFTIKKAAQKITVKVTSKTLKYSTLKNRSVTFSICASSKNSRSYSMVSRTSTKLSVNKTTGKITVKKGTKKGTYKIKVKITAKSSGSYLSASLTKTITVKVQ